MIMTIVVLTLVGAGVLVYRLRKEHEQKPEPIRIPIEDDERLIRRRIRRNR
jgi:hypothetical protein